MLFSLAEKLTDKKFLKPSGALVLIAVALGFTSCTQMQQEPRVISLDTDEAAEQNRKIEQQVTSTEVAEGIEVSLWASEQLLGDPVGLDIDNKGRAYVTVTNRSTDSEFDIRGHRGWIPYSMTWTTVEDRRKFLHEEFAPEKSEGNQETLPDYNEDGSHDWRDLAVLQEEIYVVEDSSGDGIADRSHRYIKGLNTTEVTDVLGSVLHDDRTGDVFAAVAPDVWRLKDTDGDGMADFKESISHGYAVHIGFSGHGMSGLIMGPDGKIYWGIGDIGSNVTDNTGKKWPNPNRGIIARANPDGSDFEIFAHGVRNTHEFVFDKYGNLISVDNDGDHAGESERIVHLIGGSDSGWRTNWQFGKYTDPRNNEYKVWMDEEYFKPRHEGQTAHILPPVALYHSGPSGMAYNPGTALNEKWQDHFFVAEFVGSARSAIHAFTLKPKGASFELEETKVIQRGILGTSMDFGPDGALYVTDWIEGWDTNGKGRIWKLDTSGNTEIREETQQLLADDFSGRDEPELLQLIGHRDIRVRMKAQFELADRGDAGFEILLQVVRQPENQLARIHAIWGIGQVARQDPGYAEPLTGLLQDPDPEIRAQAARVIGEEGYEAAAEDLIPLLQDEEPRPRMYAAQALGWLEYQPAIQPILDMLEANNDEDVYLRQAGAIALSRIGNPEPVVALHDSPSRALRMAAVITLKRMQHPGVARFLNDEDKYIVTDAARAIGDDHFIKEALPELAALLDDARFNYEPLIRRVINANLYVGTPEAAQRVARFATQSGASEAMRVEAVKTLGVWSNPSIFDRITGRHRGAIQRDSSIVRDAVQPVLAQLFSDDVAGVRVAAAEMTGRLYLTQSIPDLVAFLRDDPSPPVRIAALEALSQLGYDSMNEAMETALNDHDKQVRMTALEMVPALSVPGEQKAKLLASVLDKGTTEEQQTALRSLGEMHHTGANTLLEQQVIKLINGELKPEIQLDVILAVEQSESGELISQLEQYQGVKQENDPAKYSETLHGGNAGRGRRLFYRHDAAQCVRCHVVDDFGGDVGPPLNSIGSTLSREQLLESLVDPGARIAPGYGTVAITLQNGDTVRGIIQEESSSSLTIQTAQGEFHEIDRANIKSRQNAPSSMPPMGLILSRSELRDMIEFLANQK